jgi:phosphate transport system substrate-binding protein
MPLLARAAARLRSVKSLRVRHAAVTDDGYRSENDLEHVMRKLASIVACVALVAACEGKNGKDAPSGTGAKIVAVDGSSTVYPLSEAVAEEVGKGSDVKVTVGVSGTGGGFKKLCAGEIAAAGASRPVKQSEIEACQKNGIEFIEIAVAFDGIAIVVNPQNDWVQSITVDELKKLWEPEAQGKIMKWSDVRAGWPAEEIHLFGAGVDSGTYDFFTQAIVGKEHASRGDFTSSEDDNVLVRGISGDKLALGFFGLGYYIENKDALKLIAVDDGKADNGAGPIAASMETVRDGTYQPLSRPLFIYINKKEADRPEVTAFVQGYLTHAAALASTVGYVPLPPKAYDIGRDHFMKRKTGSMFGGSGSKVGVTILELLGAEG